MKRINMTWIRHGMTLGNEKRAYIGATDEDLSELGRSLLLEKRRISDSKINLDRKTKQDIGAEELVFVSPKKRCRQTAEILFPNSEQIVIDEFSEMKFGTFEGKNYEELKDNPDYQRWLDSNGTLSFPGGEGKHEFCERCLIGFEKMVDQLLQRFQDTDEISVAAIVHGGTIMAVLSHYTEKDYYDFQCKNGEGYRCVLCIYENGKIEIAEIKEL